VEGGIVGYRNDNMFVGEWERGIKKFRELLAVKSLIKGLILNWIIIFCNYTFCSWNPKEILEFISAKGACPLYLINKTSSSLFLVDL
jgi:hypothetical protein